MITNRELDLIVFSTLIDKFGSDYFSISERERILNLAFAEYFKNAVDNFEINSMYAKFLEDFDKTNSFNNIDRFRSSDLEFDCYRITAVMATFSMKCNGLSSNEIREVRPIRKDEYAKANRIHYTSFTDSYPGYVNENGVYVIKSQNKPISVHVSYIRNYKVIDLKKGNEIVDATDEAIKNHIVKIAVRITNDIIQSDRYEKSILEENKSK